jgi:hypothetical protein
MRTITIEIPEPGEELQMLDVVLPDGRRCNGLAWDEMLRQVVALTHPGLRDNWSPHTYPMATAEQWAEREAAMQRRAEERRTEHATTAGAAMDALRQWAAAERDDDAQEMANARAERDRIVQGT